MATDIPAFPGAEGYGAQSIGGRGGRAIEVTNLNDSGPGSLRAAIDAVGLRIVIFRVGGTIELVTPLVISNPYITIAGQTAPGGGITLKTHDSMDNGALEIATAHVILRYVRIRPGPMAGLSHNVDALILGRTARYVMIDHCSFSWSTDETISIWYDASDITMQWSIISEALWSTTHDGGPQSYGLLVGDQSSRVSIHHNLFAHNHRRNPRVTGGDIDIVNNVIYNPGSTPSRLYGDLVNGNTTGARYNYVGNLIKPGPDSLFDYEIKLTSNDGSFFTAYVAGNIGPRRPNETLADLEMVEPEGRQFMVANRHSAPPVTTQSAQEAYGLVLNQAGVTLPQRDSVDSRVIGDVRNGAGRIIADPSEVGGWPVLAPGLPPTDADHDGMADGWESSYGLNPTDAGDGAGDLDGDGYTNVEEYLNGTNPGQVVAPTATATFTAQPPASPTHIATAPSTATTAATSTQTPTLTQTPTAIPGGTPTPTPAATLPATSAPIETPTGAPTETSTAPPTQTPLPTATATSGAAPEPVATATPTPLPAPTRSAELTATMHIGQLSIISLPDEVRQKWRASVTVVLEDQNHIPVPNVAVSGYWSGSAFGAEICMTDVAGTCQFSKNNMNFRKVARQGVAYFTIDNIAHSALVYAPAASHNVDDDAKISLTGTPNFPITATMTQPTLLYLPLIQTEP
ncbi:MAG: hypothetical protein R3A44_15010 [Caldilineaceae bacterium]